MKARVVKNPEVRRKEIIEAAKILFEKKGYENTPVEQIINAAKIAKGTFYYYFKTKKDILNEIVNDVSQQMYCLIDEVSKSRSISAMEKINRIFVGQDKKLIANPEIMNAIHVVENRELQEKLNIYYIEKIIPVIADVFNQGYEEGLWSKKVSVQSMRIILGGGQFILDSGLFVLDKKQSKEYIAAVELLLESVCGAVPKTFRKIFNKLY